MPEWLLAAGLSGLVTGAVTYGAIRVELRYLRRDIDRERERIDKLRCHMPVCS